MDGGNPRDGGFWAAADPDLDSSSGILFFLSCIFCLLLNHHLAIFLILMFTNRLFNFLLN